MTGEIVLLMVAGAAATVSVVSARRGIARHRLAMAQGGAGSGGVRRDLGERVDAVYRSIEAQLERVERDTAALQELDTVVLLKDRPEAGLRAGDVGAVVQVYAPDAVEVEFVTAAGRTLSTETLRAGDLRPVRDDDVLTVRSSVLGREVAGGGPPEP